MSVNSPSADSQPAVEARSLTVLFGTTLALAQVDLTVGPGERLAVFGPNGAGKTTLLRTLATLIRPTSGELRLAGLDASRDAPRVRRLIGVVTHQPLLYGELTARENLAYYARLYGVPEPNTRVNELLDYVELSHKSGAAADSLSRGMQQRLALARALLHDPPILLLDEPDTGLDVKAFQLLESVLLGAGQKTVLLTTHDVDHGLELAGQAAILVDGRLVRRQSVTAADRAELKNVYRRLATARAEPVTSVP